MGNFQYQKKEIDTALMYWNSALRFNPDDYLALSNIGSTLAKDNHIEKAKYFFEQSISIKPNFSNALLGLGIIHNKENKHKEAFTLAIKILKSNPSNTPLYNNAFNLAFTSAKEVSIKNTSKVEKDIEAFQKQLEELSGKTVSIAIDENIETPAKISIAEYHNKDHHQLLYKNTDITVQHLILHELYHLKLVVDARQANSNMLFTSYKKHQDAFFTSNEKYIKKLRKQGVAEQQINKLITSVFHGLNSQIYNTPIDLFIEDLIYNEHEHVRPLQCISLTNLVNQGISATTSKQIVESFPKKLISKSKVLNLVNALHLKNLYGVDMLSDFKPSKLELSQANRLFEEFIEYRNDKEASEEYELVQHWAEDLNIAKYFKLEQEKVSSKKTAEEVLDEINKDPYGLDSPEPQHIIDERQNFINQHANKDTNKAVTFYMVGAISVFNQKSIEEVKKIALEFAHLGMTGIDVNKNNYEVPSLDKTMSGYQTLAYYYVSWAIAIPEMLSQLQMPFDKEYAIAKKIT
jgi:tetratricopeptide (TPR) repeat protein